MTYVIRLYVSVQIVGDSSANADGDCAAVSSQILDHKRQCFRLILHWWVERRGGRVGGAKSPGIVLAPAVSAGPGELRLEHAASLPTELARTALRRILETAIVRGARWL